MAFEGDIFSWNIKFYSHETGDINFLLLMSVIFCCKIICNLKEGNSGLDFEYIFKPASIKHFCNTWDEKHIKTLRLSEILNGYFYLHWERKNSFYSCEKI